MIGNRTVAGTPDYPIWALPTPLDWRIDTGDITRATGVEIPIGSVIEWRPVGDDGITYDIRVLAAPPRAGVVLVDWVRMTAWKR